MDFTVTLTTTAGVVNGTVICHCTELAVIDEEGPESAAGHVAGHVAAAGRSQDAWFYVHNAWLLPQNASMLGLTLAEATRTTLAIAADRIVAIAAQEVTPA